MSLITSDTLRNISVKTVEGFLNNKVPLSIGLAKQASALELNSEQIQRAVEATNSIAYLKILSMSSDRTVEFPLCKFAEVMVDIAVPTNLTKLASMVATTDNKGLEKSAGVSTVADNFGLTESEFLANMSNHEKQIHLVKLADLNRKELSALKDRETTLLPELMKAASIVEKDPQGLEKLATISFGKEFSMVTSLVYGEAKTRNDTGIFKEAELKQAEDLTGLLKEAMELSSKISEKTKIDEDAEMVKQALFGFAGNLIGRAIGGIVKAPITAINKGIKVTADAMSNKAMSVVKNTNTSLKPVSRAKATMAIAGTAAAIGTDASFYKPGVDQTTGRSKDVWTSLQREST